MWKQDRERGGGAIVGELAWATMSTHLIKTQHKARVPFDELDLVRGETISLRPYHNGPSPEFGTMVEGTATWGTPKWSVKR